MIQIDIVYEGSLHCSLTHGPSGQVITTDAPKDNHGKGESFSPTDLVAAALGSCMLTLMGIFAGHHGINLNGTETRVTKEMVENPRRIGRLTVAIDFPPGIPHDLRQAVEQAALTCPVRKSLHPEIETPVDFRYPD